MSTIGIQDIQDALAAWGPLTDVWQVQTVLSDNQVTVTLVDPPDAVPYIGTSLQPHYVGALVRFTSGVLSGYTPGNPAPSAYGAFNTTITAIQSTTNPAQTVVTFGDAFPTPPQPGDQFTIIRQAGIGTALTISAGTINVSGTADVNVVNAALTIQPAANTTFTVSGTVNASVTNSTLTVEPASGSTFAVSVTNSTLVIEPATGTTFTVSGAVNATVTNSTLTIQPAANTTFTISGTVSLAANQVVQVENVSGGQLTVAGTVNTTITNSTVTLDAAVVNERLNTGSLFAGGPITINVPANNTTTLTATIPFISTAGLAAEIHAVAIHVTSANNLPLSDYTILAQPQLVVGNQTLKNGPQGQFGNPDGNGWMVLQWYPTVAANQIALSVNTLTTNADTLTIYWYVSAQATALDQDTTGLDPIYVTTRPRLIGALAYGTQVGANTNLFTPFTVPTAPTGFPNPNTYIGTVSISILIASGFSAARLLVSKAAGGTSGTYGQLLNGTLLQPGRWYDIATQVNAGDTVAFQLDTATTLAYCAAFYTPSL